MIKKICLFSMLATLLIFNGCSNTNNKEENVGNENKIETEETTNVSGDEENENKSEDESKSESESNGESESDEHVHDFKEVTFAEPYRLVFPENSPVYGYIKKEICNEIPKYSRNETYIFYEDVDLYDASLVPDLWFLWMGPTKLGNIIEHPLNKNGTHSLYISDVDSQYQFVAWDGGSLSEVSYLKDTTMEERLKRYTEESGNIHLAYYKDGDFYDVFESSYSYSVIFEVENDGYIGYAYFIDDYDANRCMQFMLLEEKESANMEELYNFVTSIQIYKSS